MRLLRFFQSIIQISFWFLNDDYFNTWNFSRNCFFIWSSIFLYLMIKSCNIFFMKIDIISKKIYDFAKTRIASSILNILWKILTINFSFRLYFFILALLRLEMIRVSNQTDRFDFGFWFQSNRIKSTKNQIIEISVRFGFCRSETDWNRRKKSTYKDVEMYS
jgi:hypothetical protein